VETLRTHQKLVSLIEKADTGAVSALASAHLRATQRVMLDQYGGRVIDASSPVAVQHLRSL
jgi:GntR family transcriptional regulator, transcriptional repressor for pyruvate dehydrogenase complex